jgi:hypothetical protein
MSSQAKHAYGNSENLMKAVESGAVDAYDILFLDGDTDPKIGWVDKDGNVKIVKSGGGSSIVRVDELPTSNGDINAIYVYNNECYIWDGTKCVPATSTVDTEEVEETVDTMIDEKLAEYAISSEDIEELFK